MSVIWTEVGDEVVELAEEIINQHHPGLRDARIGFIFRSEAPYNNGKVTLGADGRGAKLNGGTYESVRRFREVRP